MMDETKTIYPTRKCFDDSLELMVDMIDQTPDYEKPEMMRNLFLVHAIVEPGGQLSSHAWLEHDENECVYFVGLRNGKPVAFASPRGEYRRLHNVIDSVRYRIDEVYTKNRECKTYGPWEPRFQELCGNGDGMVRLENLPAVQVSE